MKNYKKIINQVYEKKVKEIMILYCTINTTKWTLHWNKINLKYLLNNNLKNLPFNLDLRISQIWIYYPVLHKSNDTSCFTYWRFHALRTALFSIEFHHAAGFINGPINMTDNHDTLRRMRFSWTRPRTCNTRPSHVP